MTQEQKETRIQEIRRILLADEGAPSGEVRQALLDEQHELEVSLQAEA